METNMAVSSDRDETGTSFLLLPRIAKELGIEVAALHDPTVDDTGLGDTLRLLDYWRSITDKDGRAELLAAAQKMAARGTVHPAQSDGLAETAVRD